mmetsp:Transcript_65395/g.116585  ORF Transcript_65395/g.116585 Transcript_65395/m.116585 type:complete len:262 (-) Transcript_65395:303-1088(-)
MSAGTPSDLFESIFLGTGRTTWLQKNCNLLPISASKPVRLVKQLCCSAPRFAKFTRRIEEATGPLCALTNRYRAPSFICCKCLSTSTNGLWQESDGIAASTWSFKARRPTLSVNFSRMSLSTSQVRSAVAKSSSWLLCHAKISSEATLLLLASSELNNFRADAISLKKIGSSCTSWPLSASSKGLQRASGVSIGGPFLRPLQMSLIKQDQTTSTWRNGSFTVTSNSSCFQSSLMSYLTTVSPACCKKVWARSNIHCFCRFK